MRKILLCFSWFIAFSLGAKAQKNENDQAFFRAHISKLPSFKDQRIGNKVFSTSDQDSDFEFFLKLYGLVGPIRDMHLSIYTLPDTSLMASEIWVLSAAEVDSLKKQSPLSANVTGTYYDGENELSIVRWRTYFLGAIAHEGKYYTQFLLVDKGGNHFDYLGFKNKGTGFYLHRNVVYLNERLSGTPWKKYRKADFVHVPKDAPKFEYRKIQPTTGYLRLGSFATNSMNIAASNKFYEDIKAGFTDQYLVVDLRNNGGGGYKTSGKFLRLLRQFKGKIYLLINGNTLSNAEQFTLDLKSKKKVRVLGEASPGMISYGSNYGKRLTAPSGRFQFYPTDMSARRKDLPYEERGVQPHVALDPFKKDWVEQVMDYIRENE